MLSMRSSLATLCGCIGGGEAQAGLVKTGLLVKAPNTGVPVQSLGLAIANNRVQTMTLAETGMGFTLASGSSVVQPMLVAKDDLDPCSDCFSNCACKGYVKDAQFVCHDATAG